MDDYVPPPIFLKDGKNLQIEFDILVEKVARSFPRAQYDPKGASSLTAGSGKTAQSDYTENMNALLALQEKYFLYKNEILANTKKVLKDMQTLDGKITKLDTINKRLQKKLNSIMGSSHSAEGMLDDSKITRNQIMVGNLILFFLLAGGGYVYYTKYYNKPSVNVLKS